MRGRVSPEAPNPTSGWPFGILDGPVLHLRTRDGGTGVAAAHRDQARRKMNAKSQWPWLGRAARLLVTHGQRYVQIQVSK